MEEDSFLEQSIISGGMQGQGKQQMTRENSQTNLTHAASVLSSRFVFNQNGSPNEVFVDENDEDVPLSIEYYLGSIEDRHRSTKDIESLSDSFNEK